ncbi:unnamed protein product [Mycena citricolor]|uniref:Uncharacterized protein n=1 Tax=Mycena citricolor TaxID=2018698 RepID=A0AAD2HBF1_9AGAR|nr:unnamed protein product [Mycena citricolor]
MGDSSAVNSRSSEPTFSRNEESAAQISSLPLVYRNLLTQTPQTQRTQQYPNHTPIPTWKQSAVSQWTQFDGGSSPLPNSSPTRESDSTVFSDTALETPTRVSQSSAPSRKARARVTRKNPVFGEVQGAMQGAKHLAILRNKALREKAEGKKEISARFLRLSHDLIERCERLSNETGSWVHLSVQHRFATDPFLHYTLPALLKEAKEDMNRITNDFSKLFKTLMAARNESTKELHKQLTAAKEKEHQVTVALDESRAALDESRAAQEEAEKRAEMQAEVLRAKELELESYKIQLRMASRNK